MGDARHRLIPFFTAILAARLLTGCQQPRYLGTLLGVKPAGGTSVVESVLPRSPAEQAGIRPKDVITAINGVALDSAPQMTDILRQQAPGAELRIELMRGDEKKSKTVRVGLADDECAKLMALDLARHPDVGYIIDRAIRVGDPAAPLQNLLRKADTVEVSFDSEIYQFWFDHREPKLIGEGGWNIEIQREKQIVRSVRPWSWAGKPKEPVAIPTPPLPEAGPPPAAAVTAPAPSAPAPATTAKP